MYKQPYYKSQMNVSQYSSSICRNLLQNYPNYLHCIDLKQVIEICQLFEPQPSNESPEISIDSPSFNGNVVQSSSIEELSKCQDFVTKYQYLIKILYAIVKLDVPLFDIGNDILIIKNNHKLLRSIEGVKKKVIKEQIKLLHSQYKSASKKLDEDYDVKHNEFVTTIRSLDRIRYTIEKLITMKVFTNGDNLLSFILPYFYVYTNILEVFGN